MTELFDGDGPLALVADVHEDLAVTHFDDAAPHDFTLLDVAHTAREPIRHALLGRLIHLLLSAREGPCLLVRRFHKPPLPPLMSVAGADHVSHAWPPALLGSCPAGRPLAPDL